MAIPDLNDLLSDALGVAPGQVVPRPASVPAPPWSHVLSRLGWERMSSWASAFDGLERTLQIDFVPVWWVVAEDSVDEGWERGVIAVDADGLRAFVRQSTASLSHVQHVAVEVRDIAWVVQAVPGSGVPVERQLWGFGVRRRHAEVRIQDAAGPGPSREVPPPQVGLEPWTQVVVPAAPLEGLAWPHLVHQALADLSDVDT